jgi:dTDP-4-dehydrorhamnose 3,5-epimerase
MPQFSLINIAQHDGASIYADGQPAAPLLAGVRLIESRSVLTNSGNLVELLRGDWLPEGERLVDQVFLRSLRSGAVSGWHVHQHTTDRLIAVAGTAAVTLYDDRPQSATFQRNNRLILGAARPQLLVVPPGIWHLVEVIGDSEFALINCVDHAYSYADPDHFRLPPDTPHIPR